MSNTVYHYTSPQGAFDILRNKTLWFTDCQYLNDKGELLYIREPLEEACKKLRSERGENADGIGTFPDDFPKPTYEGYDFEWHRSTKIGGNRFLNVPLYRYYVLCTSKSPDSSSMWNYYVKNGSYQGYNLGLDTSFVKEHFSKLSDGRIKLVSDEVIYDREKQVKLIYEKIKELEAHFGIQMPIRAENADNKPIVDEFKGRLSDYINEQKLFFKNPAFASEQEYRFVLKVHNGFTNYGNVKVDFRVGASGIITPYVEWKFGNPLKAQLLKQITLSPMIEPELAIESFKSFLVDRVYENIKIEPSSIKLRF